MQPRPFEEAMVIGRSSLDSRLQRWRDKRWQIAQCAVAAGVAWFVAKDLIGHSAPFFAPVAAVVSLGTSYGQRLRRVAEVTIGVAIGVFGADLLVQVIGQGGWQITLVVGVAMTAAILLDGGQVFVIQAAVQSIVVVTLLADPGAAFTRWTDALIGGAVALVAATVVPAAPLRRPRVQAAKVVRKVRDLLHAAGDVMVDGDVDRAMSLLAEARGTDPMVRELQDAADEGLDVVASSPFRIRHGPGLRKMAELVEPMDRALRSTRVLVRQCAVAAYRRQPIPHAYAVLTAELAAAVEVVAIELDADRLATAAQPALLAVGAATGEVARGEGLAAEVVLAQLRAIVADLLLLTGMDPFEATDAIPPHGVTDDVAVSTGACVSWVLHVDLDQFIAAVEMLRRPELVGRPVVVGGRGDPTERGVVATASYAAREHGVGSGMPLRVAARKIPDAVFLPVDRAAYDEASQRVMATLRGLEWSGAPVVVEVLGWDEAFLGPGEGHGDLGDPRHFAQHIRDEVLAATDLHCGVGIGDNKLRAKIATAFGKTGEGDGSGTGYLTEAEWYDVMGDRPTTALWGIGSKIGKRLAALGIHTVRELAESDARMLADAIGPTMGPWYHRLGRGADTSPVDATPWTPRAHGREETFQADLTWDVVPGEVRALTARVVEDIDREGRPAARVGLKVRYRPFITVSRSLTLPTPTNDPVVLADAAVSLLDRVEQERPVRLLGVRLEMVEPEGGYVR